MTSQIKNNKYSDKLQVRKEYLLVEIPRILQFPNQRACKQNCAKSDSSGAPLIDREFLCSVGEESGSVSTTAGMKIEFNQKNKFILMYNCT